MNFTAAIDISTFIWCEQDYNANRHQYYELLKIAPSIYEKIKELKLSVLFREDLYKFILGEFPHSMVNEISSEFGGITLSFLTNTKWFSYEENNDNSITSIPPLTKSHFSVNIQSETQNQICHLFNNNQNSEHKFIAYNYFFNHTSNLVVNNQNNTVEIDTLRYRSEEEIINFFETHRFKFEHNPKHTRRLRYSAGEKISPFTCYHQPDGEAKARKLFEEAIFHQGYFYNFDLDNNVYVRFLKTHIDRPIYHGHDLSDENQDVPQKIKQTFNKNGRVF